MMPWRLVLSFAGRKPAPHRQPGSGEALGHSRRGPFGRIGPGTCAQGFNPQTAGLQIALYQHGLYRGPIDGVQGPEDATGHPHLSAPPWPRHRRIGRPPYASSPRAPRRPVVRNPLDPARQGRLRRRRAPVPTRSSRPVPGPAQRPFRRPDRACGPPLSAEQGALAGRRGRTPNGQVAVRPAGLHLAPGPAPETHSSSSNQPRGNAHGDFPALRSQRQCDRAREPGRPGNGSSLPERGSAFRAPPRAWR